MAHSPKTHHADYAVVGCGIAAPRHTCSTLSPAATRSRIAEPSASDQVTYLPDSGFPAPDSSALDLSVLFAKRLTIHGSYMGTMK